MKKVINLILILIGCFLIYWVISLAGATMSNYSYADKVSTKIAKQNEFAIVVGDVKVTKYDGNKGTAELYCQSADKASAFVMELKNTGGDSWSVTKQTLVYKKGSKEGKLFMPYWWHKYAYGMGDVEEE